MSMSNHAGTPSTVATSSGPCDSPAVRNRSVMTRFNQTGRVRESGCLARLLARGVSCLAAVTVEMQANIVIVGATRGFETLTYSIPPTLDGLVQPGHRVLAPLRARKVTGVVTEVGERLSTNELKPILEVLEPRPLFDRAHLQLMEFLASYYMVSIADAYRSVIPAVARVESRTAYNLATPPDQLAPAAFTRVERAIVEKITRGAATTRQLEKVGPPSEVRATIARFVADGILERRDATKGRHRETADL